MSESSDLTLTFDREVFALQIEKSKKSLQNGISQQSETAGKSARDNEKDKQRGVNKMASGFAFNQDFDSDEEEVRTYTAGRDACIFVVDCSASMFAPFEEDEEDVCLFIKCMTVLERLLLNKIISNSKELVSLQRRSLI